MPETKNVSGEYKLRVNGTTCLHVTPDGINGALGATTPAAITGTTGTFDAVVLSTNSSSTRTVGVGAQSNTTLTLQGGGNGTDGPKVELASNGVAFYSGNGHVFQTAAGGSLMRASNVGNFLIAGTSDPASAVGALCLFNGTAPTGSVTNGVVLYSEDVTASAELKVRDEAGNITTLSPHNFSLIPDGPSEPLAWAYYSERDGRKINVDMLALARQVERLSGERLVYEEAA